MGGGAHLKKLRRAEGSSTIFGVFRVKNHDFTPKNHIFSNFRRGARRVRPPPLDPPLVIFITELLFKAVLNAMTLTITFHCKTTKATLMFYNKYMYL